MKKTLRFTSAALTLALAAGMALPSAFHASCAALALRRLP